MDVALPSSLLESVLDSTRVCIAILTGAELRFTRVNPAYAALAPGTPMLGRAYAEVFPEAAAAGAVARLRRVLETGERWQIERFRAPIAGQPEATWEGEVVRLADDGSGAPSIAVFVTEVTERAAAERTVELERTNLRETIDRITDGVLVLDRAWRYTFVSERAGRIIGMEPNALVGGCVWELFPDAVGTRFHENYHRAMATGQPVHFEEYYPAPLDLWLECHCYPANDALTVYFRDVSARKRGEDALRESEAKYRTLFETMQQGFALAEILIDDAGRLDYRILELNPRFEQLTGQRPERFLRGRTVREVAPELEDEWFQFYGGVGLTGEAAHREIHAQAWDRWFEVFASRVGDPELRRVAIFFSEITRRKRVERALHEADRRKDEFLAMLAHELRNPLAPLRTAAHLLQSPELPDAQRLEAQAMIGRQVATMTRLVDDLLEVSRLSLGRIELRREPVSLGVAIEQALEAAQPAISTGGHHLVLELEEPAPWVNADLTRLAQVFTNLLTNAAKYTLPGGNITVSARAEGAEAVVCVRDTGVGIPREFLTRVFDLFAQLPTSSGMSLGGMGIGLALAKKLVELHGGAISALSEGEGRGSEFRVRLPSMAAPGEPVVAGRKDEHGAAAGSRVLVVDDNVDAAESLAMLLELQGHRVHAVHSGEAALEALATEPYQAVLLDIGMPRMDGYEVARRVRQRLGAGAPVLIALTGWGTDTDRTRATAAGFDHHLTKPADPLLIARLIRTFAGRRE